MKKKRIVNKILKDLRIKKGLTQEQLASKANINEKYLGKIEREESNPTIEKVLSLCNALDTTIKIGEHEIKF